MAATSPSWFPLTKLHPPQTSEQFMARPDLGAKLYRAALSARLTLLSAPAGSGKSTLAAALSHNHPELLFSWLTLDADDNDLTQFINALVAAMQTAVPELGQEVAAVLASGSAIS